MAPQPYAGYYIYSKDGNTVLYHGGVDQAEGTIGGVLSLSGVVSLGITAISNTIGGEPLPSNATTSSYSDPEEGVAFFYDVTPEPETITGFFLDGQEYQFAGGGGGGGGHDYSWETKTITSGAVELGLRTIVEPNSNFTLNAPSDLQDGMEYVLRCVNGSTAYTLTLGTGFVNDFSTDLTLHANHSDQFTFVAVDGSLELQPEYSLAGGGSGGIDFVTSTEYSQLTPEENKAYFIKPDNGSEPPATLSFTITEGANNFYSGQTPTLSDNFMSGGVGNIRWDPSSYTVSFSVVADEVLMYSWESDWAEPQGNIYTLNINQYTNYSNGAALGLKSKSGEIKYINISIDASD